MHIHSEIAPFDPPEASNESEGGARGGTLVEIHNACSLTFEYALTSSDQPLDVEPTARMTHSIAAFDAWAESVPFGEWIHVFHGEHWLGAVWVVACEATMTIPATCDLIEVSAVLHDGEARHFALHWELEGEGAPGVERRPDIVEPVRDATSESWLPEQDVGIELPLTNWCGEALDYAFTASAEELPTRHSTLPALTQRVVEVPSGWWLHHRKPTDDLWHAAVSTHEASRIWLAANCIDHGVGFGAGIEAIESLEGGTSDGD